MENNNKLPTNVNLAEVVKCFTEVDSVYNTVVKTASRTISKIADSDISKSSIRKFQTVSSITDQYVSIITSVVKSITDINISKDVQGLYDVLGYIAEVEEKRDKDNNIIQKGKASKFVLIDGILAMGQVFSNVNSLLTTIGKTNYGKNFLTVKANIKFFKRNVNDVIKAMVDSFSSLDMDRETIDSLMGSEVSSKFNKNTYFKGKDVGEKTYKDTSLLSSSTETTTTNKKYGVLDVFNSYLSIVNGLTNLTPPSLIKTKVKITKTNRALKSVLSSITDVANYFGTAENVSALENLANVYTLIGTGFSELGNIVANLTVISKQLSIAKILKIVLCLNSLYTSKFGKPKGILIDIAEILNDKDIISLAKASEGDKSVIFQLSRSVKQIGSIVAILLQLGRLSVILRLLLACKTISILKLLLTSISKLTIDSEQIKELTTGVNNLTIIMGKLTLIISIIIPLGILSGLMLLGPIWLLLLGIKAFGLVIKALEKIPSPQKALLKVALIGALILAVVAMGAALMALSLMAEKIQFLMIFKFFGALIVTATIIILLGLLVGSLGEGLAVVVSGLAALTALVTAVFVMALELKLLQDLELDEERIKNSVTTVMSCALLVIKSLFGGAAKALYNPEPDEDTNVFKKLLMYALGGMSMYISVYMACPILILTVVSVTLIFFIAVVLRFLQEIKLERETVVGNVQIVLGTAQDVIKSIFYTEPDTKENDETPAWAKPILGFAKGFLGAIGQYIGALISIPVLAYTFLSVTILLFITIQLRLIQLFTLEKDKILGTISTTMSIARALREAVLVGDEKDNITSGVTGQLPEWAEPLKKVLGFYGSVVGGVTGLIGTMLTYMNLAYTLLSVAVLFFISSILVKIGEIQIDESAIIDRVNSITNIARTVREQVLQGKDGENPMQSVTEQMPEWMGPVKYMAGFFGDVIGGITNLVSMFLSYSVLVYTLLATVVIFAITKLLNSISQIELDESTVLEKVNIVLKCSKMISGLIFSNNDDDKTEVSEENRSIFSRIGGVIKGGVNAVTNVASTVVGSAASVGVLAATIISVSEISYIASLLNQINEFDVDEDTVSNRVSQIIRLSKLVSTQVNSTDNTVATIDSSKVKSFSTYVTDSIRLMKQINKLDSDKIVKYSDMWVKMTEFMDKIKDLNIDEISDAIVNKIAPAMVDISDNVDRMGTDASNRQINVATNPAATVPNTVQPTDPQTKLPAERMVDYTDILLSIKRTLEEYLES